MKTKVIMIILILLIIVGCDMGSESIKKSLDGKQIDFKSGKEKVLNDKSVFTSVTLINKHKRLNKNGASSWPVVNQALNNQAVASSEYETYKIENINDGNDETVWAALDNSSEQWFYIDLQSISTIRKIRIDWLNYHYAKSFFIGFSNDGQDWTIYEANHETEDDYIFTIDQGLDNKYQYVGLLLREANFLGYAISEFEVYTEFDDPDAFISKWYISDDDKTLKFPLDANGHYDFTIHWGDGRFDTYKPGTPTQYTYDEAGDYIVIVDGLCEGFGHHRLNDFTDLQYLTDVLQWGKLKLHNKGNQFGGIGLSVWSAKDLLDVSNVTNMESMFVGADNFNQDISNWDVSNVMNMRSMFEGAENFNQDISGWTVDNVEDMSFMFYRTPFNQNLNSWNVEKVERMVAMFAHATNFNGDISLWKVGNVTSMKWMFLQARSFNQDISNWAVSKVIDMNHLFYCARSFNQDISSWNVSNVTDMSNMFTSAMIFNQDLSSWKEKVDEDIKHKPFSEDAYAFETKHHPYESWDD